MSAVHAFDPAPVLLAHQNGWDEFLLVAGPMVVIAGLLWLAKRRVDAAHAAQPVDDGTTAPSSALLEHPDENARS